jgi:hypothetical protein
MNIVSPVDSFNEAESLIGSGANELYGGYLPDFWIEKYGHVTSLNRRSFRAANIASLEELDRICELCWKKDVPFHLALNVPIVPEGDIAPVVDFASELAARGVSAFIVSDLNLLSRLSEARLKVELHASTLLAAFSLATIRFFTSFGVRRVILSRELALGETCELAKKAGGAKLDIIAFRGKCPNIEGYCSHLHDDPDRRWPCSRTSPNGRGWTHFIPAGFAPFLNLPLLVFTQRESRAGDSKRRRNCGLLRFCERCSNFAKMRGTSRGLSPLEGRFTWRSSVCPVLRETATSPNFSTGKSGEAAPSAK